MIHCSRKDVQYDVTEVLSFTVPKKRDQYYVSKYPIIHCSRKEVQYDVSEGATGQYSEEVQSQASGRHTQAAEETISDTGELGGLPRGTGRTNPKLAGGLLIGLTTRGLT